MTTNQLNQFKTRIESALTDVEHCLVSVRAELHQLFEEQSSAFVDEVDYSTDGGLLDLLATHERRLTANRTGLESALRRIQSGTFGRCRSCDGSIHIERLIIVPTATVCVECL